MKRSLIIGASGGIGTAMASALEARGGEVVRLSRRDDGLDITDEASIIAALGALQAPFDLIFTATGALEIAGARPEKSIKAIEAQAMMAQFALNAVGPALVIKHSVRLLHKNDRSVLATLSARVGSISDNRLGGWISYRTAKAAANQVIRTSAIEIARTHSHAICVGLHPGTVQTPFTQKYLGRHPSVPADQAAQNMLSVIDGLTPEDTGSFFDWSGKPVAF